MVTCVGRAADGWNGFMKTLAAALITALLVYTLATAWTDLVQPRMEFIAQASATKSKSDSAKSKKRQASRRQEIVDEDEDDDSDPVDEPPPKIAVKSTRLARKQREDAMTSEIAKARLIAQMADVKDQESRLLAREETLKMLYEDIRSELVAVEDIRRRSANELAIAERKILDATASKSRMATNDPANEPLSNARLKSSSESRIASVIQDLASQGNVAAAASLLSGMKDREVAKVLTSLSARDPRLAMRISDQVQAAKQDSVRR